MADTQSLDACNDLLADIEASVSMAADLLLVPGKICSLEYATGVTKMAAAIKSEVRKLRQRVNAEPSTHYPPKLRDNYPSPREIKAVERWEELTDCVIRLSKIAEMVAEKGR